LSIGSVVVVGAEDGLGGRVARGLSARGFRVELASSPGDRGAIGTSFKAATAAGPIVAAVHAHVPPDALQPRPLVEIADDEWDDLADAPVRATLVTLQLARGHLQAGGRMVVVVPAVALVGQDGLVPLCTAGEAQRVLAKSAARRWGADGLTVNIVAADLADLGDLAAGGTTDSATTRGPALPTGSGDDLVDAISLLLEPAAARITGATLCADAGDLMP
jgi:NAD(P)-dependent dehydrogenase (short-subunit alcohol dehydrogenase family)